MPPGGHEPLTTSIKPTCPSTVRPRREKAHTNSEAALLPRDHGGRRRHVLSRHLAAAPAASCPLAADGHLPRGDGVRVRGPTGPPRAPRAAGVRPREPRLRPPRRWALHRRLQRPRPPLARAPPRLDRVRPQLQARGGGDVRGEEAAGGAGERVRAAAGPAVPPGLRRPLLRGRVPGADARGAARRALRGGGHGGRRRAAQLRQRRRRRPGDGARLLHGQQRHVPAERLPDDRADQRRDGAAASLRPVHGQHHRAGFRPVLPQRRGGERRRVAPRGGRDRAMPPAPPLAARGQSGRHGELRRPAGLPGQRAPRRRPRRRLLLGGAEPGQGVDGGGHDAAVGGGRQGTRGGRRGGGGAARARERHRQRGRRAARRRALARVRRHALRRTLQDRRRPLVVLLLVVSFLASCCKIDCVWQLLIVTVHQRHRM